MTLRTFRWDLLCNLTVRTPCKKEGSVDFWMDHILEIAMDILKDFSKAMEKSILMCCDDAEVWSAMSEVAAVTRRDVGTTASLTSIPTLSQVPTHSWTRPTSDDSDCSSNF